ncbi:MAG: DNA alkylation repair protein [Candidatus Cloacimonadaceae bacterium]
MHKDNEKLKEIIRIIEKFCYDREDPVKAMAQMRMVPEGCDAFGIEDHEIKLLRDRILTEFTLSMSELVDLAEYLLSTGKYEFGGLAIRLLKKQRPRLDLNAKQAVRSWLDKYVENWVHADVLGLKILPVFRELSLMDIIELKEWCKSPSKWMRRACIGSLNAGRRPLKTDEILDFILPYISDNEKVVQQSIGFCLAAVWQKSHQQVEDFLAEHKEQMHNLSIKHATSGMSLAMARSFRKSSTRPKTSYRKPNPKPPYRKDIKK